MGLHGFWMNIYIAAIRSGQTTMWAKHAADQAVRDFKTLDVDKL